MLNSRRLYRWFCCSVFFLLFPALSAEAGAGAGQLLLDPPAVSALLVGALPGPTKVKVGNFGTVTVVMKQTREVRFTSGSVEATLLIRLAEPGLEGEVTFRLVPEINTRDNTIRLRAISAMGRGALAILPNLAFLLPPVVLPRVFESYLQGGDGSAIPMAVSVEKVEVSEAWLRIGLGLATRPPIPAVSASKPTSRSVPPASPGNRPR